MGDKTDLRPKSERHIDVSVNILKEKGYSEETIAQALKDYSEEL